MERSGLMRFRTRSILLVDGIVEARDAVEARHLAKIDIAQDTGYDIDDDMVFVEPITKEDTPVSILNDQDDPGNFR